MIDLPIQRLAPDIPPPAYQTEGASGLDVHAACDEPLEIAPGGIRLVPTGLKAAVPQGYEIQVRPRSGWALKKGITVLNTPGTIDADYRGEIGVILINHGADSVFIERGDRIAQLCVSRIERVRIKETEELPESDRGAGGFGSTGH